MIRCIGEHVRELPQEHTPPPYNLENYYRVIQSLINNKDVQLCNNVNSSFILKAIIIITFYRCCKYMYIVTLKYFSTLTHA